MTKELKNYYRQVSTWLPCGGRLKKQLMSNISATIDAYLRENPDADFDALQAHFGTPQQIASAFVDEMGTDELLNTLKIRRKVVNIALASAAVMILIFAITMLHIWSTSVLGYYVTELVIH